MAYVEGFIIAVPAADKDVFQDLAGKAALAFRDYGITRLVDAWGDAVPDGKVTDFKGAVQAKPDEVVVFAWIEYPNKEVRDAASKRMMSDPHMEELGAAMPFDGKRMVLGGFAPIHEDGEGRGTYLDGMVIPVPAGNKDAYLDFAAKTTAIVREHGALRVVDAWEDEVPDGKLTDFRRAVKLAEGEKVVFSWVEWPSKEAHDLAWASIMADERMMRLEMPFDGKRLIHGAFEVLVDGQGA